MIACDAAIQSVAGFVTGGQTWSWNGATWSQLHPATNSEQRAQEVMTYDSMRQKVYLHGELRQCAVCSNSPA